MGVPANRPPTWQRVHSTPTWAPVSGKRVRLWSMVAPGHCSVVWQFWQVSGKFAARWLGLVVAS